MQRQVSPEEQKVSQEVVLRVMNLKVAVNGAKGKADGIINDSLSEAFSTAANMAATYALQNLALQKKVDALEKELKEPKKEPKQPEPQNPEK